MAMDFTVIQPVRQHFGDFPGPDVREIKLSRTEEDVEFVGASKDYIFSCPNVDRDEWAVLQFESLGVNAENERFGTDQKFQSRNIIRIKALPQKSMLPQK